ncbi:MAG TPA: response regulator transcription factor [Opitutaceae bacterium]
MPYDLKVMVVDDDDHVRTFLVVLLRKLVSGAITEARNGSEAVHLYQTKQPDLVLLDVNMPVLDGLDALAKIREINPDAVVIMITSLAMRRVVEAALQGGACNFVRKDTPRNQIAEIVTKTIETYLLPVSQEREAGELNPPVAQSDTHGN